MIKATAITEAGRSVVFQITNERRRSVLCAYYGKVVVENGWEPFDQPSPGAYMPHRFHLFDRTLLENGGAFLVMREVRTTNWNLNLQHHSRAIGRACANVEELVDFLKATLKPFEISTASVAAFTYAVSTKALML